MLRKKFSIVILIAIIALLPALAFASCTGTCAACSTYSTQSPCTAQGGCSWAALSCSGTPSGCSTFTNITDCQTHGCNWNQSQQKCVGNPSTCSTYTNQTLCTGSGCTWSGGCSGTCAACSTFTTEGTCTVQSGCTWQQPAAVCGNNVKETGETCDGTDLASQTCITQGFTGGTLSCAANCLSFNTNACTAVVCGNNTKEGSEVCDGSDLAGQTCVSQGFDSGTLACQANCSAFDTSACTGTGPVCGNGTREGSEVCDGSDLGGATCVSQGYTGGTLGCRSDCAAFDTSSCTGAPVEAECITDCCGNHLCEESNDEDFGTCIVDCFTPATLFFTFYSPGESETFSRGERVLIKVGLKADSIIPPASTVEWVKASAPSVFGTIELFDDGEHDDGEAGDGVYANAFQIRADVNAGEKTITIEAKVVNTQQGTRKVFIVDPTLGIDLLTDKTMYVQGDLIEINGFVKRGDLRIIAPFDFNISFDGNILFDSNGFSKEDGSFILRFQTTTINPKGNLLLNFSAKDSLGNSGFFSKQITLVEPKPFSALSISLIDALRETISRGEQIKFTVNVLDEYGEFVKNAEVELVTPSGETIALERGAGKFYTGVYTVPWDSPSGNQAFKIETLKKTAYSVQRGENSFGVGIEPSQISFELLEPKQQQFAAGEEINFQLRLTYVSGEPVTEPVINAFVNKNPISLVAVEKGIYVASYSPGPLDSGRLVFSVSAEDQFANAGAEEYELSVSGISWLYWVKMFPLTAGLLVFAFFLSIVVGALVKKRRASLSSLRKRKRGLEVLREDVQKRYYKLNVIDREMYNKLRGKYDTELEGVEQTIRELERKKARKGA